MTTASVPAKRARGGIHPLPSGALRVKVYAGVDALSGKPHYLRETVPAGPDAQKEAEKVRTRLLNQIDEQRNPRTRATVNQLLDRHFELLRVEPSTLESYQTLARVHIRPLLGTLAVGKLNGETLDAFYRRLRTCRTHCDGRPFIEHSTTDEHACDEGCKPHVCRPLADGSLRKIHAVLSSAGKRAIRWRWLTVNPMDQAEPIAVPRANPQPPSPEQAAAIASEAWGDVHWGMLVWLAMVTGARRGELCALRWDSLDTKTAVLTIRSSIAQRGGRTWEKDTKTHQQRRITIDAQTVTLLTAYRRYCAERAGMGSEMLGSARMFSLAEDGAAWLKPDTVSQRYTRMCARLGWDMNIHQLRHYSATELIAAGVDVRTVAGRLGHGGGGATTLRVYSAWVSESDQRAAGTLAGRMPTIPAVLATTGSLAQPTRVDENSPYQRIAADLRGAITCGAFRSRDTLPSMKELAGRYGVSFGTAQRAVRVLVNEGHVLVSRGQRAVVK